MDSSRSTAGAANPIPPINNTAHPQTASPEITAAASSPGSRPSSRGLPTPATHAIRPGSAASDERAQPRATPSPGLFSMPSFLRRGDSRYTTSSTNLSDDGNNSTGSGQRPGSSRRPSVGIRRKSIKPSVPATSAAAVGTTTLPTLEEADSRREEDWRTGRRRSGSDPTRSFNQTSSTPLRNVRSHVGMSRAMPSVREEGPGPSGDIVSASGRQRSPDAQSDITDFADAAPSVIGSGGSEFGDEYHDDLVDVLDTIDPEVSTLTTLTNLQNSLFVPDLGRWVSRRAIYNLTPSPSRAPVPVAQPAPTVAPTIREGVEEADLEDDNDTDGSRPPLAHSATITSVMSESRYAVLPHGRSLAGWTQGEKEELNDHVRHMLHSRRNRMKRGLKGFGQYVRKPLGFFVTLYATLITLFGLAWVLFLIGWINVGGKQLYLINIIDYTLVALFAIMGDGLAPFRAWDTYNMIYIVHYHRMTWKLRKKQALPKLTNKNDLPELREEDVGDEEAEKGDYVVLTDEQQAILLKHQNRFARSHTFYKPHETETHYAFPIKFLVTIVLLLDCHSLLQISLGAVTWGIDYHKRPFALTTVILCCSITCNITGGVLIAIGDRRTRKKDVLERMDRQELTNMAIEKVEKRKRKAREREEGGSGSGSDADSTHITGERPGQAAKKAHSTGRIAGLLKKTRSKSSTSSGKSSGGAKMTKSQSVPENGTVPSSTRPSTTLDRSTIAEETDHDLKASMTTNTATTAATEKPGVGPLNDMQHDNREPAEEPQLAEPQREKGNPFEAGGGSSRPVSGEVNSNRSSISRKPVPEKTG